MRFLYMKINEVEFGEISKASLNSHLTYKYIDFGRETEQTRSSGKNRPFYTFEFYGEEE